MNNIKSARLQADSYKLANCHISKLVSLFANLTIVSQQCVFVPLTPAPPALSDFTALGSLSNDQSVSDPNLPHKLTSA